MFRWYLLNEKGRNPPELQSILQSTEALRVLHGSEAQFRVVMFALRLSCSKINTFSICGNSACFTVILYLPVGSPWLLCGRVSILRSAPKVSQIKEVFFSILFLSLHRELCVISLELPHHGPWLLFDSLSYSNKGLSILDIWNLAKMEIIPWDIFTCPGWCLCKDSSY